MDKFYGPVGFAEEKSDKRGIHEEEIIERDYYGDILRNARRLTQSDKVIDDISVNNEISILADPYAMENFFKIRYVGWMGAKWKVTNVEVKYPRLVLTIGGVFNE